MTKRTSAIAIAFALIGTTTPSSASLRLESLGINPKAPQASQFVAWGPTRNGLQAAIMGPAAGSLNGPEYFAAIRNVSATPIYMCGLPWSTIILTSRVGSDIAPTSTPVRAVFSPFTQTIEVRPSEEWVVPQGMVVRSSYKTKPSAVSGILYELEINIGGEELSSCQHATTLVVKSASQTIDLSD